MAIAKYMFYMLLVKLLFPKLLIIKMSLYWTRFHIPLLNLVINRLCVC